VTVSMYIYFNELPLALLTIYVFRYAHKFQIYNAIFSAYLTYECLAYQRHINGSA
jgi:hypothetical protein